MVSDRAVLAILDRVIGEALPRRKLIEASFQTLRALCSSGVEEASEEGGQIDMIPPDRVLTDIHHYKTGLLFNSPWAVPNLLEDVDKEISAMLINALYNINVSGSLNSSRKFSLSNTSCSALKGSRKNKFTRF